MSAQTDAASDTGLSDVDTSTNEAGNADFEDADDNPSWDEGDVVTDNETDSTEETAATDSDEETADTQADDVKPDDTPDKPDESEDAKPDVSKETNSISEEERKRYNDEMAKARIAERQARAESEQARKAVEQATIERYLQEAGDDEIELERRRLDVERYHAKEERINLNAERLQTQIEKAAASIELFRTGSPAVQEELANSLDDFERMYVVKDDMGRPVEVRGDVFKYLQAKADSIQKLIGTGAQQQSKSKSNELSRTMTTPVKAPKKAKVDPDLAAFDEEASHW